MLKPGTNLTGKLFILNVSATSNAIEDYNRDGILNNGETDSIQFRGFSVVRN